MKNPLIRKSNIIEEVIEEVSENSEKDSSSFEKKKESKNEVNYLYDRDSKDSFKENKNRSTNELKKDTRKLRKKKVFQEKFLQLLLIFFQIKEIEIQFHIMQHLIVILKKENHLQVN